MTPETEHEQPIIPPYYLLIIALIGLIVAIAVLFTQPTFGVVGFGGLGIMLLALLAWALMVPDQARAVLTGRTVRFGGVSLLITAVFIVALIAIYTLVRGQEWRIDLTQRDEFSLSETARAAIASLGADPTLPAIKLTMLYPVSMAPQRDRDELLFDDYVQTSAGKISYEFVDPDQNPALANTVGYTRAGQIYVARAEDAAEAEANAAETDASEPAIETGELVDFYSTTSAANPQDALTNAIVRVSLSGDVSAYFLAVSGGLSISSSALQPDALSVLSNILSGQLNWTTQEVSLAQLTVPDGPIELNDPDLDGEVVVIPGGDTPLLPQELEAITSYLDEGGHMLILGGGRTSAESPDLAADPALNDYLWENFGLRFNDDVVIDPVEALQTIFSPVISDFTDHPIAENLQSGSRLLMNFAHSLSVSDTPPENVSVSAVANSSGNAYSKSNFDELFALTSETTDTEAIIAQAEGDPVGPFPMIAAAENSVTGAKVVLVGSVSMASNNYASVYQNLLGSVGSMTWATGFELSEFITQSSVQSAQRPEDSPILVDQEGIGTINFITVVLLPFGILALGLLVWWNNRETAN